MTHQLGHIVDIMATCVEVAGARYPKAHQGQDITPLEGRSLLPVFEGRVCEGHSEICWEHEGNKAICQGDMKLVSRYPDKWELYDLEADRTELHDLSARYPDKVVELARLYDEWAKRCDVEPWSEIAPLADESFRQFMDLPEDWQPTAAGESS
jgi:arylsulfatase